MTEVDFERARACFIAGTDALQSGRLEEAESQFMASLQALPGRPSSLVNLAAVRRRLGRPGEAIGPLEQALAPESRFRTPLARARPGTTITLWCYPDSFAAYRGVREELHRLGIPVAGRPLPDGAPIGGSVEGSKSVVQ